MGSRSKGDARGRPQPICRPRQSPSSPIAIAGPDAKHPTESSPRLDDRQPTLHDFSRKITRPVRENVTIWVAGDCRPINRVEDSGLIEVIRIASGEILTIYRRGAPLCLAYIPWLMAREHEQNTIKQQCLKYTLSEVITRLSEDLVSRRKQTFNHDKSRLINFKM